MQGQREEAVGVSYRQLRQDAGLSQEDLAKRAGVSRPTIRKFENDLFEHDSLMPDTIAKIRSALLEALRQGRDLENTQRAEGARIWHEEKRRILDVIEGLDERIERGDLDGFDAAILLAGHLRSIGASGG